MGSLLFYQMFSPFSDKALLFTYASGSIGFAGVLGTKLFALGWDEVSDLEHH